jgi:probable F420-dependent oxidoreductase
VAQFHPFRFGVVCEQMQTADEWLHTVQQAENLHYSTILIRDHFVREPFGDQLAPLIALMAAASVTKTLRVGTLVLDNDYRHPVMLAKEAATLDLLSQGRFELGIGAGWLRAEYEQAGMPFDSAGTRVGRLEEALQVLKGLLSGQPLTFAGTHYTISNLSCFPKPVQRPHPPILVGAGSKRMLMIAAREADIIGILPKALQTGEISEEVTERLPTTMAKKIDWIREAAGERFEQLELSMIISPILTADRQAEAQKMIHERGWHDISVEQVLAMPSIYIGSLEQIAEDMRERRERYGFSYFVISDAHLHAFAPLVKELTGE